MKLRKFWKNIIIPAKLLQFLKIIQLRGFLRQLTKVYIFGENRVQEAKTKFVKIKKNNPKIELHLTGPLQSNKVKDALLLFDVFHTVDREKIAKVF